MTGIIKTKRADHKKPSDPLLEALRKDAGAQPEVDIEEAGRRLRVLTMRYVSEKCADSFAIPVKEIYGQSRQHKYTVPRQIAMYLCRDVLKKSLPRIGNHFERDHTSVIHACKKIEVIEGPIKARIEKIKKELENDRAEALGSRDARNGRQHPSEGDNPTPDEKE